MLLRHNTGIKGDRGETVVGIINMVMRAASLLSRLALSIYMARMISFEELGLFGLIVGIVGITPSVLGFGIGYFVRREVLTLESEDAFLLIRDRFVWNAILAAAIWFSIITISVVCRLPIDLQYLLIAMIVTLEFLAFDTHIALINMRRPIAANVLLFVRSAFWIVPVILLGAYDPIFRSIDTILILWTCALIVSLALSVKVLPDAPWKHFLRCRISFANQWHMFKLAPLVYVNDVATNGQVYVERFVIAQLMGMMATGIYTLYFSVAHGLYILVSTAVTQVSVTRLADLYCRGDRTQFSAALRREAFRAIQFSVPIVFTISATALYILPAVGFDELAEEPIVLGLMLVSSLLKLFSDLSGIELFLRREDRKLAIGSLFSLLAYIALTVVCVHFWGLVGAGIASVVHQTVIIAVRNMLSRA